MTASVYGLAIVTSPCDLTSKFREFLHLLPNGFSYPTTITMCFLRAGYPVKYVPITAAPRVGRSHIRPLRDGLRFVAKVPDTVNLKVEFEIDDDETELEIELTW